MITVTGEDRQDLLRQLGFGRLDPASIYFEADDSTEAENAYDEAANSPMAPDQRMLMFVLFNKIYNALNPHLDNFYLDRQTMSQRILGRYVGTWAGGYSDTPKVHEASKIIDALRTTCVVLGLEDGPL